jgi:exonuclease III
MATFLFWNINRKPLHEAVATLSREHNVDVIILAESRLDRSALLSALNRNDAGYAEPLQFSERIKFYARYAPNCLTPILDDTYISIHKLRPPIGIEVLIAGIHLPSKLYRSEANFHAHVARRVVEHVASKENELGHRRTIIMGDFNMNPFDSGMTDADAFHALMDKANVLRVREREFLSGSYPFFYNPMWSRLGDESNGPPGSYYFNGGQLTNMYWHMLDQVLLRPELLPFYSPDDVSVITEIAGEPLLFGDRLKPGYSDHLPLLLRLDIEKGDA